MENDLATAPPLDNNARWVSIDQLFLDPENPRLPELTERDQKSMLDHIAEKTSIEELMEAIGENDFFPGEPLIVVPHPTPSQGFIVVEGNRRLSAVKLLANPNACSSPGSRLLDIARNAIHKPLQLPVLVRPNRADVLPYLGFRHITGVKPWEPLAKARYIKQLFDITDKTLPIKSRYNEVARSIGSRRDHIRRNLDALAVYAEIKDKEFYDIPDLDEMTLKFAVLSTAISDDRIGVFIGAKSGDDSEEIYPISDPSMLKEDAIKELTYWLFQRDEKGRTTLGESRNLRQLSAVVSNERAIAALRKGSSLSIAYQLTSDISVDFTELLYRAEAQLTEAASMVAKIEFDGDAFEVAKRIQEQIKLIGRELKSKKASDDDF